MAVDPRFSTMPLRARNIDTLYREAGQVMATRTTEEWEKLLTEADIPVGRVNNLKDLKNDPHEYENLIDDPKLASVKTRLAQGIPANPAPLAVLPKDSPHHRANQGKK